MTESEFYRLTLLEDDYFRGDQARKDDFYDSLFKSFSLLSWFNQSCGVQINNCEKFMKKQGEVTVYAFVSLDKKEQRFLVEFCKNQEQRSICYMVCEGQENLKRIRDEGTTLKETIKVVISRHTEVSRKDKSNKKMVIYVDIEDKAQFVAGMKLGGFESRLSEKKRTNKSNEIEYYYKEPLSQRNKQTNYCHFNLAFQGGGAKGVSYVGVYKALKELHKNTPINSVIGSSAGGILALAISSEMSPDAISNLCLEMNTIPGDKHYKTDLEITPEAQAQFDRMIHKIKCLLHNYGLVEASVFDQFKDSLFNEETGEKILNVLQCINPSIAELFSLDLKETLIKTKGLICKSKKQYTRKFNYYGLLQAGMMKGDAVEEIACLCLVKFIQKHYDQVYIKANPHHKSRLPVLNKLLMKWGINPFQPAEDLEEIFSTEGFRAKVKTLTLEQYYHINEVEFTCTSVDLDDRILRFFNHKTTPNLPVCKTVQMTGSFPVAFKAQKWQKEWGKYYIHYTHSRKEVDLTGHQFTDGGLLANFPIKYLDNELMRPMYFSHKKSQQYSILYGFGLDPIEQKQTPQLKNMQLQRGKAIAELKQHISSNFSKLSFIKNLIASDSKVDMDRVELEEIPVLNYLFKLMKTLTAADYNLNMECFEKSIVETSVQPRILGQERQTQKDISNFTNFTKRLDAIYKISTSKRSIQPKLLLKTTCQHLKERLLEFETPDSQMVEEVRNQVLQSLFNYQGIRIKYQFSQCPLTNKAIKQLEHLYHTQPLKMQQNDEIRDQLVEGISLIENFFVNLPEKQSEELKIIYSKMLDAQLDLIQKTKNKIEQILHQLNNSGKKSMDSKQFEEITFLDYQLVFDLMSMEKKFFITDQEHISNLMKELQELNLPVIGIDKQILDSAIATQSRLTNILNSTQHNKIHLVLEAKENSHLYYCGLFSLLQQLLNRDEYQHKRVEMITSSDSHAVFAFLLAGGKKIINIRKEMWKVKDLICFQDDILEEFNSFKWAKSEGHEMSELLELTWKDQYALFDQVQKYLTGEDRRDLAIQVSAMRAEFLYSKDTVTQAMENLLDYVIRAANEAQNIKDPIKRKQKLAAMLSLRNGKSGIDYQEKNKKISENTQRAIKMMMVHFGELVSYVLANNYLVQDTFEKFDSKMREKIWKGAVAKRLLSSKRLQLYIKQKLEDMKLNSNTTLSEFYEFCPRKITLNFTLINKGKERMEIINRFTRPNMPIWAAIIASTSLPLILPEFNCREQWEFSPYADSRMRKLMDYFFHNQDDRLQTTFISGNYVSTLPLELLTNQKIATENYTHPDIKQQVLYKQKLTDTTSSSFAPELAAQDTNFTYITFSFSKKDHKTYSYAFDTQKKQFLTFSNLISIGIDFMMGKFANIKDGLKDILHRTEITKFLSTRIQCHDNTIMNLYYDQTIKLPVRLGTLDFYKIKKEQKEILHSCIYEAEFVVRGIFQNLKVAKDNLSYCYTSCKTTYLEYSTSEDCINLSFLSRSKWNRKLATMYDIFYRTNPDEKYLKYQQEISIPLNSKKIYLKFVFPNLQKMLIQEQEMELDLSSLPHEKERLIFCFNYEKVGMKAVKGIPLEEEKLKTRVIPASKPRIEDILQDSAHQLVKTNSKSDSSWGRLQQNSKYLFIKTLVDFKHNGLQCKGCTKPLVRSQGGEGRKLQGVEVQKCGKCHSESNIIGFECMGKNCRVQNKYCFQCLLVYLIKREDGSYKCTPHDHCFDYCGSKGSSEIILCHFCGAAATSYYRDSGCDINICFKCSLVLDSKKTVIAGNS